MSALLTAPRTTRAATSFSPRPLTWTCKQFHMLGDMGVFEGARPMLIDGHLLEQGMMNPPHAKAMSKTHRRLQKVFELGWHLRGQSPLVFGLELDPMPDLAAIAGSEDDYADHPTTAALVVEIADSSLKFDTTEKMSLYAAAMIPEYWVLDLTGRQLIVYRDPVADPTAPHGGTYRTALTVPATGSVNPLANPTASVAVADLLD